MCTATTKRSWGGDSDKPWVKEQKNTRLGWGNTFFFHHVYSTNCSSYGAELPVVSVNLTNSAQHLCFLFSFGGVLHPCMQDLKLYFTVIYTGSCGTVFFNHCIWKLTAYSLNENIVVLSPFNTIHIFSNVETYLASLKLSIIHTLLLSKAILFKKPSVLCPSEALCFLSHCIKTHFQRVLLIILDFQVQSHWEIQFSFEDAASFCTLLKSLHTQILNFFHFCLRHTLN